MKLYELPFELESLMAMYETLLTDSMGEVTPEVEAMEAKIADYLAAGADKVEAAAMVIKNLEADAGAAKVEAARLSSRASSIASNVDRLKKLTQTAVIALGGKVKTARFSIYTQNNPPSWTATVAPDADLLAIAKVFPAFVKVEADIRKSELIAAMKEGRPIPFGISLTPNPPTVSLRIK